jgi:hypothetical protein
MALFVSTWMYVESVTDGGIYPQVSKPASDPRTQEVYWRCTYCFFELARRFFRGYPQIRFQLFTNLDRLPWVNEINLSKHFEAIGVEVVRLDYTRRPAGKRKVWYNQFYIFDILTYWLHMASEGDLFILSDSDCVFVRDPEVLLELLNKDDLLLIDVDISPDEPANGITRREAGLLCKSFDPLFSLELAPYFGGEFYGLSKSVLRAVMLDFDAIFNVNNDLASKGGLYLSDEAHFMSFLISKRLGLYSANANSLVRRIWTGLRFNNTKMTDLGLTVWHLPAEKTYGFRTVFNFLVAHPKFLTENCDEHIRIWLANGLGVGKIHGRKVFGHFLRAVGRRLRKITRHFKS